MTVGTRQVGLARSVKGEACLLCRWESADLSFAIIGAGSDYVVLPRRLQGTADTAVTGCDIAVRNCLASGSATAFTTGDFAQAVRDGSGAALYVDAVRLRSFYQRVSFSNVTHCWKGPYTRNQANTSRARPNPCPAVAVTYLSRRDDEAVGTQTNGGLHARWRHGGLRR